MKVKLLLFIMMFTAFGCSNHKPGWKTIDMGEYQIDVPNDFHLQPEKGIDSQPGLLKGRDFDFGYDYGAYSDTLISTTQEYIKRGHWKDVAIIQYLNLKLYPDVDWAETKILSYRPSNKTDSTFAGGCDFIANCNYKNYRFNLPIFIPQEIKDHVVMIDTVHHHYRRLASPVKTKKGIIGVYMRDERGSFFTGIQYPALVISTRNLKPDQQILALEILNTLRPKPKN